MSDVKRSTGRKSIDVHVKTDVASEMTPGSRWVVVSSSLDSLWDTAYTVTLEEVADGVDG
jgi:hypothetical protein